MVIKGIKLIILDRPNPNGFYFDGPVLKPEYRSFLGMHEVPIVHGMTLGEMAGMINGEQWLENNLHCDITVIRCKNWDHMTEYILPVKPSPNLLCLFEGTVVSEGRGTPFPFQVYGHPDFKMPFSFTPEPLPGGGAHNKFPGRECFGEDLRSKGSDMVLQKKSILIEYIIKAYEAYGNDPAFFSRANAFDKLAGTDMLRKQIIMGYSAEEIRKSWQNDLMQFGKIRKKYLLYPDFE